MENVFDVQDEIGRRVVGIAAKPVFAGGGEVPRPVQQRPGSFRRIHVGSPRELLQPAGNTAERRPAPLASGRARPRICAGACHAVLCRDEHPLQFDPQHTWLEKAEHHCHRALTLDPGLPEGHLARSWILWSPAKNFQHADAIAALEQVLAAQPNFERAHNRMASICLHIGRLQEARIAHEQAAALESKDSELATSSFSISIAGTSRAAKRQPRPGERSAREPAMRCLVTHSSALERETWIWPGSVWRRALNSISRRALAHQLARHAARPAQPNRRCARVCAEGARFSDYPRPCASHLLSTSPAFTPYWAKRKRRWHGWSAASTPASLLAFLPDRSTSRKPA